MLINESLAQNGQKVYTDVPANSLIQITANVGASVKVEYSKDSAQTVRNNAATWVNWPKGTVPAASNLQDSPATRVNLRVTASSGSAQIFINDAPQAADVPSYRPQDWYSGFTAPVVVDLAGSQTAVLVNPLMSATNAVDNYTQISTQNKNATANASADHIVYPDNIATDATGYNDMGITSSAYAQAAYSVTGPNEGYLFMSNPSTNLTGSGDLVFATDSTGTNNGFRWYTNGFTKAIGAWAMKMWQSGMLAIGAGLSLGNLSKVIANNGATTSYTVPASASYVYITTSAASLAMTLPAAAAAIDGLIVDICTSASVATATWASTGATFVGAPTSFTANTPVRMIYDHASLKWYPF